MASTSYSEAVEKARSSVTNPKFEEMSTKMYTNLISGYESRTGNVAVSARQMLGDRDPNVPGLSTEQVIKAINDNRIKNLDKATHALDTEKYKVATGCGARLKERILSDENNFAVALKHYADEGVTIPEIMPIGSNNYTSTGARGSNDVQSTLKVNPGYGPNNVCSTPESTQFTIDSYKAEAIRLRDMADNLDCTNKECHIENTPTSGIGSKGKIDVVCSNIE